MSHIKKLQYLQTGLIGGGVILSWTALFFQFQKFIYEYGTLFKFRDCTIPNPIATPCFLGAIAFLMAFFWSISNMKKGNKKDARWLRNFLLFGTIFASSVLIYEFIEYYHLWSGPIISCSPGTFPLLTPCFYGFLFFLASFIVAKILVRKIQNP